MKNSKNDLEVKLKNAIEKYEESEDKVRLFNVTLREKVKLEESMKNETNSQIDEALQYIKLIENEFCLDNNISSGIDEDVELKIKIEQLPEIIKNIYRSMVNIMPQVSPLTADMSEMETKAQSGSGSDNTQSPHHATGKQGGQGGHGGQEHEIGQRDQVDHGDKGHQGDK